MDTPEGLRLRLMTLLSLYELLPYSISNPPNGAPPLTLEEAIGPEALRRCLAAMNGNAQLGRAELSNILRGSRNSNTSGQNRNGYGQMANSRCSTYPMSSYQPPSQF